MTLLFGQAGNTAAIAALLWWRQQGAAAFDGAQAGGGAASFLSMLAQTLFALGLVCGLAYAVFRWALPRLNAARSANSMVRVVDRTALEARRSLYVVEVAGRWLLIASSEGGVQLISELDAKTAAEAEREVARLRPAFGASARAAKGAFADRLAQIMNRKGGA